MANVNLPKSWYPAALSKQVGKAPHAFEMFGAEYVLFRGQSGRVSAIERFCAHMGADLSRGRVVDDGLQCPLHGWTYDSDGGCAFLEAAKQSSKGRLDALATHETGGIVFAWPGKEPDWPFPDLPNLKSPRAARPRVETLPCPLVAIGLNGFDIWHYGIVHRRKVRPGAATSSTMPHHLGLNFTADVLPGKAYDNLLIKLGYGELSVRLDYWGGNLILVRNQSGGYLALIALRPHGESHCQIYLGVFAEERSTLAGRVILNLLLEVFREVAWRFLQSDVPMVTDMRPRDGVLVAGKDDIAAEFWRWWKSLPRLDGEVF